MADDQISKVMESLWEADVFTVAVRGFSAIEAEVTGLLADVLPQSDHLELARLSIALKVDLGVALGRIHPENSRILRLLARIRNGFAHEFNFVFSEVASRDLWNALSETQKREVQAVADATPGDPRSVLFWTNITQWVALVRARRMHAEEKISADIWKELVHEAAEKIRNSGSVDPTKELSIDLDYQRRYRERSRRIE